MVKIFGSMIAALAATTINAQSTNTISVEEGVSYPLAVYRHAHIHRLAYRISLTIPSQKANAIAGNEELSFELDTNDQPLQLDFKQDASHIKSVKVNHKNIGILLEDEHLLIDKNYLIKGINKINIEFIAGNESLNRNNDYLYALFVPDRARTVFPCFDQPDLKAVFTLTLAVPSGWKVLANARVKDAALSDSVVQYHFAASDQLPTYLFSFTAGKYTAVSKLNMQLLHREKDTYKIRLSVDSIFQLHRDAVNFLQAWTNIAFPFQKIGFVAVPSYQFGGMEHPGEVQYDNGTLFLDGSATKDQLIARTSLISHETAHMWFGDLVTMQWFNDVWMKEVFANFMADKVTENLMGKATFNLKFLQDHYPAAYSIDRTPGANPIRQQLDNLRDAGSLYGNIIYHKAPIMMRQLELLMGQQSFRQGVKQYLKKYAYSNASWNDLVALLSKHTRQDLISWNKVWVNEPGRPVFDYEVNADKGIITVVQHAETKGKAVWPQRFSITLVYSNHRKTVDVNMKTSTVSIHTESIKPLYVLFNSNGIGYGLFPAVMNDSIYTLQDPLQRASAYINMYENMLAGRDIEPDELLKFFVKGVNSETNELNLRLITGYLSGIWWQFITPAERTALHAPVEQQLWTAMKEQLPANNKKIVFKIYQNIYLGSDAARRIYEIWQTQKAPDRFKLAEDDYTALALTIALKTDTVNNVLQMQAGRILNEDRRQRLQFLIPALSPDSTVRDSFFISLAHIANRRKESWATAALSYMNHPLRQQSFIKYLPKSLDMLQEIQSTGDIFFPQSWLGAIFSNYQTKQAWAIVQNFLHSHPAYNKKLTAKILQATDNLNRAQQITTQSMRKPVL
jgi:aminopeptidase N